MADKRLDNIKNFRLFVRKQINSLTNAQLNVIPHGYNNNIIWNLGHMVSTMQVLCYKRVGLNPPINDKYITPFLPGTKPAGFISEEEVTAIKELLLNTIDTLQSDLEKQLFNNYTRSERIKEVYAIDVSNIDDALDFLLYHEGYHTAYILALKHLV